MNKTTIIEMYGSLRKKRENVDSLPMSLDMDKPEPLKVILDGLRIDVNLIQMVMVNHKACRLEVIINPGDRVALFPMEYPIFADWYHYRSV